MTERDKKFWIEDDGVHSPSDVIAWDDIDKVYFYALVMNFVDFRELRVESRDGRKIKLLDSALFKKQALTEKMFALRERILERVSPRQWSHLMAEMDAGNPYEYIPGLGIDEAGIMVNRDTLIAWVEVDKYELDNGQIYLTIRTGPKPERLRIATVAQTANLHLLTRFMDMQLQRYGRYAG